MMSGAADARQQQQERGVFGEEARVHKPQLEQNEYQRLEQAKR